MTRWAMVADLRRCVGCQTCTASCKHANATPPGVQWRRVLDIEMGEYPDVQRAFVPMGCQHCDEPPCAEVCPTTATRKRADGVVTIDYDLCIGCAYCTVACPYQARFLSPKDAFAYGNIPTDNEELREDEAKRAVATKCTFCVERLDAGLEKGLKPGVDPEATPACVNACIAEALVFGDIEDPASNVSQLLARTEHFRINEELGTGPGFYYLWSRKP
jgi:phenylacetyl-CoA:acceptor oxidoreductase 27-kDa subunit